MAIKKGYILIARKILDSGIMEKPPLYLKLWVWMLNRANYKDTKTLKRGQFFTSIAEMQEAMDYHVGYRKLTPKVSHIRRAYEWFTKSTMVSTTKSTRGMVVTILNYSHYQDPKNYEEHDEEHDERTTKSTVVTQGSKEVKERFKKEIKPIVETPKKNGVPSQEIIELYHSTLPELPRVIKLTDKRKTCLKSRWYSKVVTPKGRSPDSLDFWEAYFNRVRDSKFLMGDNDRGWKADFDFLITESKFISIIEGGKYR